MENIHKEVTSNNSQEKTLRLCRYLLILGLMQQIELENLP